MKRKVLYAHSLEGHPKDEWQLLECHLREVAQRAKDFAAEWGAGDWAYWAGLWHDLGKFSQAFQDRICSGDTDSHIEALPRRVDHSTAGAQQAGQIPNRHAGRLLAYMIAGHHAGLPDGLTNTDACLERRLDKDIPSLLPKSDELLSEQPASLTLPFQLPQQKEATAFRLSFFTRMLFSCVVDADFLDTERFMDRDKAEQRVGYPSLEEIAARFFPALHRLNRQNAAGPVNAQRAQVLEQCLTAADREPGLFSLTVPTGGGKTLSSLAFALRHALRYGKQRVIYVIPFTTIIEQNAKVFRRFAGTEAVVEHHSNFEPRQEDHRSRLAAENWDAPIIVTTNIQFFESLFACRTSACRKLHNIANSVVILDEAQTLPVEFLRPCLETLRELTATYRTSIVLCTATQPALTQRDDFPIGLEKDKVREIVIDPVELARGLKRVNVTTLGKVEDAELVRRLVEHDQVLCVVSTRRHARTIYKTLPERIGAWHLSALMCPAHRSLALWRIRRALKRRECCRVISTQLVEAGVDIDFPVVYRALAGIDSIAQAAGRCNREGRLEQGQVYVFEPEDGIRAGRLRQTAQTAKQVMRQFPDDFMSLEAVEEYFRNYYWLQDDQLDAEHILGLLSADLIHGNFPFREVADKFQIIRDGMQPVIIPWNKRTRALIQRLPFVQSPGGLLRKLQRYTVQIHPIHWNRLVAAHSVELVAGEYAVLSNPDLYSCQTGLCMDDPTAHNPESLIV